MTTNKPEVVAWYTPATRGTLPVVALNDRSQRGEPLIRLSDYETLQARTERLAEALECALTKLEEYAVTVDAEWGNCRDIAELEADNALPEIIKDVRAVLADYRKGGDV